VTPYLEALEGLVARATVPFHMPGHLGRAGSPRLQRLAQLGLAGDWTQVAGLDDIHHPTGACGQAQRLAAEAYGAEQTYFLVNGSSVGNQAALLASARPGQTVLLPRNAHFSALSGVWLCGAEVHFYDCLWDPEMGVFHPPADLPEVSAQVLFLSTPSFYGATAPLKKLVDWGHRRNMVVIVDEAWGAHLDFHPSLPMSALRSGADLVIQSTHKLAGALSQASMLHLQGQRVDRARLAWSLRCLQTSSPNSLLLASLDVARADLQEWGRSGLERALALAADFRRRLAGHPEIRCFDSLGDPTRLVVQVRGYTGFEVDRELQSRGVQVELSDPLNVLALLTLFHQERHTETFLEALQDLPARAPLPAFDWMRAPRSQPQMTVRQAFEANWESVPWSQAAGRICVECLCPYPPGIAWVVPGEVLTPELIEALHMQRQAGASVQGAFDLSLERVRVVRT
jgi:arginine decarboxylase